MIASLTLILLAQLLGEGVARSLGLPVPGPVLGMALMLTFLIMRDRPSLRLVRVLPKPLTDGTLEATGRGLLSNLSLMFVPAGAGIVGRLDVMQAQGLRLAVVVVLSTAAALVSTVFMFIWVARLTAQADEKR